MGQIARTNLVKHASKDIDEIEERIQSLVAITYHARIAGSRA